MFRKKTAFILACLGIISAGWVVKKGMAPAPQIQPVAEPCAKPYQTNIAAAGIIEAVGENIALGAPVSGIVQAVFVNVWQQVKKGEPLFQIDSRELEADLKIQQAKEEVALAEHKKISDQLARLLSIKDPRAISQEELLSKQHEASIALAKLHQTRMEKEKILSLIERQIVHAPIDGIIIQKNIKAGEFLVASQPENPPLVVGDISTFQIRVDIDEQNASRIVQQASGIAYPKNRPDYPIPLTFVRIEPYVVPKKSLTGSSKEKVDTRVLQVIYTFAPPEDVSLYIGQQVDVYIERDKSKEIVRK
jgi:multidrug efflux pump subunit AcrA (membrane-fusion protein)